MKMISFFVEFMVNRSAELVKLLLALVAHHVPVMGKATRTLPSAIREVRSPGRDRLPFQNWVTWSRPVMGFNKIQMQNLGLTI